MENLKAPILVVELAFGDQEHVLHQFTDQVIQLRTEDVLWHKEALLNIGMTSLPPEVDKICWLDMDIFFGHPDWYGLAEERLNKYDLIQPFETCVKLPEGIDHPIETQTFGFEEGKMLKGIVKASEDYGLYYSKEWHQANPMTFGFPGYAWAAQRKILEIGLYSKNIIGGADTIMASRALNIPYLEKTSEIHHYHQLSWMNHFAPMKVGYLEGVVYHRYHGNQKGRQYDTRSEVLRRNQFNPLKDVGFDERGVLKWNSKKPELHRELRDYFLARKEDE